MKGRVGLFYPALFAAGLVLYVAASHPGQFAFGDLLAVICVAVGAALLWVAAVWLVVAALDRGGRRRELVGIVGLLGVAWFCYYVPFQELLSHVSWRLSRDVALVPAGLLATLAIVWWAARQPGERVANANRFLARVGVLLVALSLAQVLFGSVRGASRSSGPFARALAAPVPVARQTPSDAPKRDIYLLVLDGHANDRVMRETFGVREFPFTDSLRALGFTIPGEMRSNYTQTVVSLPSLLNFEYMTRLAQDAGERSTDFSLPRELIERNRTARFLKERGYKYVLFPSAFAELTESSPIADVRFDARPGFDLADALNASELRLATARSTLLRGSLQRSHVDSLHAIRSLKSVAGVAKDPAPTFTFLHVLLPHVPFVFDADCTTRANPITETGETDTPEQRTAYVDQMQCVDRLVLDAVRQILRDSPVPPVILVVGDHGSRFTDVTYWQHPEAVTPAFVRERFGALGAFYLPDGGAREFRDTVSLVNVMRNVLRHYFGASLPPLPDEYYTSGAFPFKLHRVDDRWLAER
jgi:hypothetical protein